MTMQDVIASFSTVDENGNVTSFDFANFDELVSQLVTERAKIRKENKEAIKEQKKAAEEANKEIGEAYYKSLSIGDVFTYKTADGTELKARKIETKSKSGLTAGCELVEVPAGSKSAKRYPKFHQLVVPQAFIDSMNTENAEEVVA
jgi:hypothetical protein